MLEFFKKSCEHLKREQSYKVWQDGYHAEEVFSNGWIKEKINYIHQNPAKEKIAIEPESYYFSSARNYADLDSALDIEVVFMVGVIRRFETSSHGWQIRDIGFSIPT